MGGFERIYWKKNDKSSIIEQIKSGDISLHEDESMANQFNNYLTIINDKINDEINPSDKRLYILFQW